VRGVDSAGSDGFVDIHGRDGQVRDVALQPGELAGPVDRGLVEIPGHVGDLEEADLLNGASPSAIFWAPSIMALMALSSCLFRLNFH
jgi:hypothetical protein